MHPLLILFIGFIVILVLVGIGLGIYFYLQSQKEEIFYIKDSSGQYIRFNHIRRIGTFDLTTKQSASEFIVQDNSLFFVFRDDSNPKEYVNLSLYVLDQPTIVDPSENAVPSYFVSGNGDNNVGISRKLIWNQGKLQTSNLICFGQNNQFCKDCVCKNFELEKV